MNYVENKKMKIGIEIAEDILNESGNYSHLQKTQYTKYCTEEEVRLILCENRVKDFDKIICCCNNCQKIKELFGE